MLTSACAESGDDAGDDGAFVVYASVGLSGGDSGFAPSIEAGIEAAIAEINENGGLLGREVRLETDNNESDPTKAVSLLQDRIRDSAPDLVWAGTASSESLALQSLTTREEIMALNNGSAPELGDASLFPYAFSAGVRLQSAAEYLATTVVDEGYQNIGIIAGDDPAGEAAMSLYEDAFEDAGLDVATESYEAEAVEVDGPLARLAESDPDVVIFNSTYQAEPVLKSRIKVGMEDVPFIGDVSTTIRSLDETLNDAEKSGVELMSYNVNASTADSPGVTNLLASLDAAGETPETALYLYALGYDPILAYANAVESVGSTDVTEVRAAMEAGEGDTYELSLSDDPGWSETDHLASGEGRFTIIPVAPLVAGQFQIAE
ncbi:ABC transporter substrate-binding protein [Nocardioides alkalitolerans]|uniref:ABC transporter substrate-binding protein n=1 Tax=Nocardioides alkalitolerans TaxID=281714 RepID=UPI000407D6F1|nr:ABC transporter substrate-binding protein [Nocardioides alkalitolerans]